MGFALRLMPRNVGDLATLTTSLPPFSTMPVSNLQKPRRARVFRYSTAAGSPNGQAILGTYNGDAYTMSMVGLDRTNFSSAATARFRGYATSDWTGAASVDTGTVSAYNAAALGPFTWGTSALGIDVKDGYLGFKYWVAYFAQASIKSWRIDLSDEANTDGYVEASRLVLGDYLQLERNAAFGNLFSWNESTTQQQTDGGSTISFGTIPRRTIKGTVPAITAAERTLLADTLRYVGMRKAFFISLQSNEGANLARDYTILQAKFATMPDLSWELPDYHSFPFSVFEA